MNTKTDKAAPKESYHYQLIDRNRVIAECDAQTLTEALPQLSSASSPLKVNMEFHFAATVICNGFHLLVQWHPAIREHTALIAVAEAAERLCKALAEGDTQMRLAARHKLSQALSTLSTLRQ